MVFEIIWISYKNPIEFPAENCAVAAITQSKWVRYWKPKELIEKTFDFKSGSSARGTFAAWYDI